MVGSKFFGEPYDFEVAVTFAFEFSAGSDLVEVSVDVEFEQVFGII